jgi:hypothetical protein
LVPPGTVEQFAEDLGKVLSVAERKVDEWLHQRGAVRTRLTELRDKATQLLERLGDVPSLTPSLTRRRRGRPAGSKNKVAGPARRGPGRPAGPPKKKRTLSAAARKAISDAQKRRWAKQKKAAQA